MQRNRSIRYGLYVLGVFTLLGLAACAPAKRSTPTPAPAAGVVLQKILNDCWGVNQIKDLDGNRADQVRAFECARIRLLAMAQAYPDAAEPHRVLAWGYLYGLKDEATAMAEYERAAEIYAQQGQATAQADMLFQISQLTMPHDQRGGCTLLQQAATLDPQNARIPVLLQNFNCVPRATLGATPSAVGTRTPVPTTPSSGL